MLYNRMIGEFMKQYTPNFDDPRVRKRCKKALGFAYGLLRTHKEKSCYTRSIDKFFGQQQTQLGKYLRRKLLVMGNPHYQFGTGVSVCKMYTLDKVGADQLYQDLHPATKTTVFNTVKRHLVADAMEAEHIDEIRSGDFVYNDKSNRYWHPLQNVNSNTRKWLFAKHDYKHIYDIKACAPTLIAFLADAKAPKKTITVKRMNATFDNFLNNTQQFRAHIAGIINSDITTAKKLINSLFAGARLGCNKDYSTFQMLNYDYNKMNALKADAQLDALRCAITKAWKIIASAEDIHVSLGKKITSRHKWAVYFKYERAIMTVITDYLEYNYIKYFIEHDGWSCNTQLDIAELLKLIRARTGIDNLQIEYEVYDESTNTSCQ